MPFGCTAVVTPRRDQEKPSNFAPNIPMRPKSHSSEFGTRWGHLGIPLRRLGKLLPHRHEFHDVELSRIVKYGYHALAIDEKRGPFRASLWKEKPKQGQTVEQVWFSGVHSAVGGSGGECSLAKAPFEWMKDRASATGLALDATCVPNTVALRPPSGRRQWFWSSHIRVMGGDSTQSMHPTARELYRTEESYRPRNLKKYLQKPEARIYGDV